MRDDISYAYAVARVRSKELSLLSAQDIDQLMAAKSFDEAMKLLADKGWGDGTQTRAEAMLKYETEKTWAFIGELSEATHAVSEATHAVSEATHAVSEATRAASEDLSPFDVLILPNDYNNLKAAIKSNVTQTEPLGAFYTSGKVPAETIVRAVENKDFSLLPANMKKAAEEAYQAFVQTFDGQLCDAIIDRACLTEIYECGKISKNEIIKNYTEIFAAVTDIKIAVRCAKTKKSLDFIRASLADCGTLDVPRLAKAASEGLDAVYALLAVSKYSEAGEELKKSYSAFEKWCDDKIMELIKAQKVNPFTIGPLFAYVVARTAEIGIVRIILSGKMNELPDEAIRERLRDMYV